MYALSHYTYTGDTAQPAASGPAWSFPAHPAIDQATVEAIGRTLGLTPDVRQLTADEGGGWMVGPADYSGKNLTVSGDALASWWYSDALASTNGQISCGGFTATTIDAIPVDPGSGVATSGGVPPQFVQPPTGDPTLDVVAPTTVDCPAPTPPANVPTKEQAIESAKQLVTDVGAHPADFTFDGYADEWSATVTMTMLVGGQPSPVSWSASYGQDGRLMYASGTLATPVRAADYPLIDVTGAVARLNDQQGRWIGYGNDLKRLEVGTAFAGALVPTVSPGVGPAVDVVVPPALGAPVTSIIAPGPAVIAPEPPTSTPCMAEDDCMPILPEPSEVTLTGVALDSTLEWAEDGTVWILPAYTFSNADGVQATVMAVQDGYIELPSLAPADSTQVDSTQVDSTPVDSTPVDSVAPVPPARPVDPVAPVLPATDCPLPPPISTPVTTLSLGIAGGAPLIGLCLADAQTVADGLGIAIRVVRVDGVDQIITADYSTNRLNVATEGGLVTEVLSVG